MQCTVSDPSSWRPIAPPRPLLCWAINYRARVAVVAARVLGDLVKREVEFYVIFERAKYDQNVESNPLQSFVNARSLPALKDSITNFLFIPTLPYLVLIFDNSLKLIIQSPFFLLIHLYDKMYFV